MFCLLMEPLLIISHEVLHTTHHSEEQLVALCMYYIITIDELLFLKYFRKKCQTNKYSPIIYFFAFFPLNIFIGKP